MKSKKNLNTDSKESTTAEDFNRESDVTSNEDEQQRLITDDFVKEAEKTYKKNTRRSKESRRRATLAVVISVLTLILVLLSGSLVGSNARAEQIRAAVTEQVTSQVDDTFNSPPVQELLQAANVDVDAMKADILAALEAEVLGNATSPFRSLSADDIELMQQMIRDAVANGLANIDLGGNTTNISAITELEQSLGVPEGTLFSEEWFEQMISDVLISKIEQTLLDALEQEMWFVRNDIDVLAKYVEENINNLYGSIDSLQQQIDSINVEINNINETLNTFATKEELTEVSSRVDQLTVELQDLLSQFEMMKQYFENTLQDMYDDLLARIEENSRRIDELDLRVTNEITEINTKIDNIENEFNIKIENTTNMFIDELAKTEDNLQQQIDDNKEDIEGKLEETDERLQQDIEDARNDGKDDLQQAKDDLNDRIDDVKQQAQDNLDVTDKKLTDELNETNQNLTSIVNQTNNNLTNNIQYIDNKLVTGMISLNQVSFKNLTSLADYVKLMAARQTANTINVNNTANENMDRTINWVKALDSRQQQNMTFVGETLNNNILSLSGEVTQKFNDFAGNVKDSFDQFAANVTAALNKLTEGTEGVVVVKSWTPSTGTLYLESRKFDEITAPTIESVELEPKLADVGFNEGGWAYADIPEGYVYPDGSTAGSTTRDWADGPAGEHKAIEDAIKAEYYPDESTDGLADFEDFDINGDTFNPDHFDSNSYDYNDYDEQGNAITDKNAHSLQENYTYLEWSHASNSELMELQYQQSVKLMEAKNKLDNALLNLNNAKSTTALYENYVTMYQGQVEGCEKAINTAKENQDKVIAKLGREAGEKDIEYLNYQAVINAQTTLKSSFEKSLTENEGKYDEAVKKQETAQTAYDNAKAAYEKLQTDLADEYQKAVEEYEKQYENLYNKAS